MTYYYLESEYTFDWDTFQESCKDCALTGDRFFIANQKRGDYHDNFDSQIFFKWMTIVERLYPQYCKELQWEKDRQQNTRSNGANLINFYDWEKDFPTRELILYFVEYRQLELFVLWDFRQDHNLLEPLLSFDNI